MGQACSFWLQLGWTWTIQGGLPRAGSQGAVGNDEFAAQLEKEARKDGVSVRYMHTEQPTGKCAVLVSGGERSLVAQLGAAESYKARASFRRLSLASRHRLRAAEPAACACGGLKFTPLWSQIEHLQQAENWAVVEAARFYYIAAFFITHSPNVILHVAKHAAASGKHAPPPCPRHARAALSTRPHTVPALACCAGP